MGNMGCTSKIGKRRTRGQSERSSSISPRLSLLYVPKEWRGDEDAKLTSGVRAIGVKRHKDQKPGMQWAGLFGEGGEEQKYGFEPEVSPAQFTLPISHRSRAVPTTFGPDNRG